MAWFDSLLLLVSGLFVAFHSVCSQVSVRRRFEYKHSFKGPHLVQRDGTIPFWEHGGHAIASDESIRVTPSLRSKKGYVWNTEKNSAENWEIEVTFRITGRGRIGADGLAIWYTEEKGSEGPVFGSNDKWKGLAVFFDSFDNDNQHNNPYILAMLNDGTKAYEHRTDGSSQQLGGCLRDFRNKPFSVRAKIEYYNRELTVFFHNGMTNDVENYELCMRVSNVDLPKEGHFGLSAATGGLADDHDVSSFITHSLRSAGGDSVGTGQAVPEDERKKFEQEFDDYYKKLQDAKDEYRKEHPDAEPKYDYEFEGQEERELKQIFDGQENIHRVVRELNRKLDEVIGRQERTLSQLSMMQQGGGGAVQQPGQPAGSQPYIDTFKRHEVDSVLSTQRDLLQYARDVKSLVNDISSKNRGGSQGGYDGTMHHNEVKGHINSLQNDVKSLLNKQGAAGCPDVTLSCVSTSMFIVLMLLQAVLFIGYNIYRSSKEASAKKFY